MSEPADAIVSRSLWLIERKERTVEEIRTYFKAKGHEPSDIDAAIARLSHMGLLDDSRYAERYITGPARRKGYGRTRIYRELVAKGVDGDVVHEALERGHDSDAEYQLLAKLGRRKWEEFARTGVPPEKARSRLVAHLARRGFPQGAIIRFLDELRVSDTEEADDA